MITTGLWNQLRSIGAVLGVFHFTSSKTLQFPLIYYALLTERKSWLWWSESQTCFCVWPQLLPQRSQTIPKISPSGFKSAKIIDWYFMLPDTCSRIQISSHTKKVDNGRWRTVKLSWPWLRPPCIQTCTFQLWNITLYSSGRFAWVGMSLLGEWQSCWAIKPANKYVGPIVN